MTRDQARVRMLDMLYRHIIGYWRRLDFSRAAVNDN